MITCNKCGKSHYDQSMKIEWFTCGTCVQMAMFDPNAVEKTTNLPTDAKGKPGWPRGWHRKKHFVAPDGREYSKGKELVN
jgi:hypothetical protein